MTFSLKIAVMLTFCLCFIGVEATAKWLPELSPLTMTCFFMGKRFAA